jgi:hypothetical protein
VTEHEGEEFAGIPVAGDVALRFGQGAKEPTEVILVCPDWDMYLVAAEESNGCTDAVDGGAAGEVAFEVKAEALLSAAPDRHNDVLRTQAVEALE